MKSILLAGLATAMMIGGTASAQGWGHHKGWHRYHVYRNHHWGYVYHPVGWTVPAAWAGPRVIVHGGGWHRRHWRRRHHW